MVSVDTIISWKSIVFLSSSGLESTCVSGILSQSILFKYAFKILVYKVSLSTPKILEAVWFDNTRLLAVRDW